MKFSLPLLVTMLLLQITTAQAQESAIKLGVRLGVGISMSPKMGDILVPEDYYSNYSFKTTGKSFQALQSSCSTTVLAMPLVWRVVLPSGRDPASLRTMTTKVSIIQ